MGNRLTKIYTRTGDDGTTGLGNGQRIEKDTLRVCVMGDVDELNSMIGVLIASGIKDDVAGYLLNIQHRLFDIGAEISVPGKATTDSAHVARLEDLIDNYNSDLKPLEEFILPGGTMSASLCHLARTVCRRLERHMVRMAREEFLNENTLAYINRLSDLLFVFARVINQNQKGKEVLWNQERLKRSV